MLALFGFAIDALSAVADLIAGLCDFRHWRDDWHRTWSPVSYWLAVSAVVGLAFLAWMYGMMAWTAFKAWLP